MIEISAGLLITLSTLLGFIWINRLSLIFTPILMVVTALLLRVWLEGDASITPMPADPLTFSEAVSAVVGAAVVGAVILPDITLRAGGLWRVASILCLLFPRGAAGYGNRAGAMSVLQTDSLLTLMTLSGLGVGAALSWCSVAGCLTASTYIVLCSLFERAFRNRAKWEPRFVLVCSALPLQL